MTLEDRITRLFVDEIEDDTARVLLGEHAFSVPTAVLPAGAREGEWVQVSVRLIPAPPGDTEARRERLTKDDPGGTIKL